MFYINFSLLCSYWHNMTIQRREFLIRNVLVNILVVLLVFFWSGPISVFATLLSLHTLKKVFPWLEHLAEMNEIFKGFIQGTLPTLAVSLFNIVLPKIMIGKFVDHNIFVIFSLKNSCLYII